MAKPRGGDLAPLYIKHLHFGALYQCSDVLVPDDNCNYNSSGVVLHVGGNYNQNQNYGLFYTNGNNSASDSNDNIGARQYCVNIGGIRLRADTVCYLRYSVPHLLVKINPLRNRLVHSVTYRALERLLGRNGG